VCIEGAADGAGEEQNQKDGGSGGQESAQTPETPLPGHHHLTMVMNFQNRSHTGLQDLFSKPYHSRQRGLNENTNGLLRRCFPKGVKIAGLPKKCIEAAQLSINIRLRKALYNLSPLEFLVGKRVSLVVDIWVI